jgi:dCTP deaminase
VILSDREILKLCKEKKLLSPYQTSSIKEENGNRIISYGLSSYGVDLRLADEFKIWENTSLYVWQSTDGSYKNKICFDGTYVIDPKNVDEYNFLNVSNRGYIIIPPNSFALGRSIEYIKMPRNVTGLATNKSTYARCGLNTPSTVLEAGWEGHLTIEMFNSTPHPIKVYSNEGIIQVLFFQGEDCLTSYSDRGGKYNGQRGITNAKV